MTDLSSKNANTCLLLVLLVLAAAFSCEGFVPSIFRRSRSTPTPEPLEELFLVDPLAIIEQNPLAGGESSDVSLAKVDWKEDADSHIIKLDVPGIKKEDIHIEYEEDVLTVKGEQKKEKAEKTDVWHREERTNGKFIRRFRLPNANMEGVKAELKDGVLSFTVPKINKKESPQPKVIPIECSDPKTQTCSA
eukprot:TRINITY_DN12436_c0_g1_i1.p1 TRINITY_DN12436_c0_g1~~TRINITY_DN12436_c0_g1_i1.p1  ORF type:complete len:191 (-),score=22.66 TRINITY_DN12436_c0_g1_i1:63-635(-)